jgi:hypothetical protein
MLFSRMYGGEKFNGFAILSFQTAQGNPFDELLLGEEEYHHQRQDAQQRTRHQDGETPTECQLGLEESQPQRQATRMDFIRLSSWEPTDG